MRSTKVIHTVSCHAEGEVGDVIVGGVAPPPGKTLWEQRKWIAEDGVLRNFMLNEPRGGVFRHVNLLVPPTHPDAVCERDLGLRYRPDVVAMDGGKLPVWWGECGSVKASKLRDLKTPIFLSCMDMVYEHLLMVLQRAATITAFLVRVVHPQPS